MLRRDADRHFGPGDDQAVPEGSAAQTHGAAMGLGSERKRGLGADQRERTAADDHRTQGFARQRSESRVREGEGLGHDTLLARAEVSKALKCPLLRQMTEGIC